MTRAVFLDRDGVLTKEKGYVVRTQDLEIFPFARECVDIIHDKGFLAIVATNQSAIDRGMMSEETLLSMNCFLQEKTGVDDVFFCPHRPGKNGMESGQKDSCTCRKPEIGMALWAAEKYKIDFTLSYVVGDRQSDILFGRNARMKTVFVRTGYPEEELHVQPDYCFENLVDFVRWLPESGPY